jgi:hypothetical protein
MAGINKVCALTEVGESIEKDAENSGDVTSYV